MPLPAAGDVTLVTIRGVIANQRIMSTFVYKISAVTGAPLDDELMGALDSSLKGAGQLITRYVAAMPSNWFHTDTWYQIIRPVRHRKVAKAGIVGGGGSGGEAHTANVSVNVARVGELAGRRYVGGVRIPIGTDEICIEDGKITVGQYALLNSLASAMKLNVITSGFVATFRPQVGLPPAAVGTVDLFDAFVPDTVRVMHRRTVGLGI